MGIEGEVWRLLGKHGTKARQALWREQGKTKSKAQWKEEVNDLVEREEEMRWHTYFLEELAEGEGRNVEQSNTRKAYTQVLAGEDLVMAAQFRLGATCANGDLRHKQNIP